MKNKYQSVRGMKDVLPKESNLWLHFESLTKDWLSHYGYQNLRTPILEHTNLFTRSIGTETDIVSKEMYTFQDNLSDESLTLRPEGTVATLRAVIEHSLLYNATQRLWYSGPMFRHERPQKGRYRQFHQIGVEALGFKGPDIDTEMILMTADLWKRLGLTQKIELHINTLGTLHERRLYKEHLVKYLKENIDQLDDDSKQRLHTNPLRILDTKNKDLQKLCENAPKLIECLGEESLSHYNLWKESLTFFNIPFKENHRLVRGLDYYNLSVFEWVDSSSQNPLTFCAGGRYDGLLEELGGKPNPGIGFAMGVERVLAMTQESDSLPPEKILDFYIVHLGENTNMFALKVAYELRKLGYSVKQDFEQSSFKSQMQRASNHQAKVAIIIGENEVKTQSMTIKPLIHKIDQKTIPIEELESFIKNEFDSI